MERLAVQLGVITDLRESGVGMSCAGARGGCPRLEGT